MTGLKRPLTLAILAFSTAAFAHQNVADPTVKARMDNMSSISSAMKSLGEMAKGTAAFDPQKLRDAAATIADFAGRIPLRFETEATDPTSEARPVIWDEFGDFTRKATTLEALALEIAASDITESDLRSTIAELGAACKACHSVYRE